MNKFWLFIAASIFTIFVFCVWIILFRLYPIALIDWKIISAKDFNKDYSAALTYYKNALELSGGDSKVLEADETGKEIKRALLENFIENVLIDEELKKDLSSDELGGLVDRKIGEIIKDEEIQKAAETLYGFSFSDFKERVLAPQAKKEILESRLFLYSGGNGDFGKKLEEIKSKARVMIFLPDFEWNGKEVIIK